jgi:hypothetical protein
MRKLGLFSEKIEIFIRDFAILGMIYATIS